MSKLDCAWIRNGLFVSHRKTNLCCDNTNKHLSDPKSFWEGSIRTTAFRNISENVPVSGCDICYSKEERHTPSRRTYSKKYINKERKEYPVLLDVDLSNFCNLKCVMCNAQRSSVWAGETKSVSMETIDKLIEISGNCKYLIVQGGEATIMPEYQYYFEKLKEKGFISNISVQIITNATNINKKFYDLLEDFKEVKLSVSVDAYGKANDYIRWPSKFSAIDKNIRALSQLKNNVKVEILNSINLLSMFNYGLFLKWCKDIEKYFSDKNKYFAIVPNEVWHPVQYSPFSAPPELKVFFKKDITDFFSNNEFSRSSKFKTELLLMTRSFENNQRPSTALDTLISDIDKHQNERGVKITDYIPNFYSYIKKSQ